MSTHLAFYFFPCMLEFNMATFTHSLQPFWLSLAPLTKQKISRTPENPNSHREFVLSPSYSVSDMLRQMTFAETGKERPGFLWAWIDERRIVRDDEYMNYTSVLSFFSSCSTSASSCINWRRSVSGLILVGIVTCDRW